MRQLDTLIPIAEGASGRVFRSRDRETGQVLAVKRLRHTDAAQVTRLRREAAAQQRLNHPNICRVFGIEQDEQGYWQLLMEFVPGSTLAREMDRLSLAERVDILVKVARAVSAAHAMGILHRDLKPSNILLRGSDSSQALEPVVADFGLARSDDDPDLTQTGEALGTPAYMAPEQALGDRDRIGPATDVFAIGCMLYEALTGKPPFEAPTVSAGIDRLLHEDAAHPRKFNRQAPEPLCRIALQCLEHEPARRYASAEELATDLAQWQSGQSVRARHYSRLYRWRRRLARHPLATAATLAGLAVIIALAGWGTWQAHTTATREALAAELGTTLSDIGNRMTIARLAPMHDIDRDRQALGELLRVVAQGHDRGSRFADLVHTSLARAYLEIGDTDRAADHAQTAHSVSDGEAAKAVWADVLLARYADALVPIMELPADRRGERLALARQQFLRPAQALLAELRSSALAPTNSLARLAILERRFTDAREAIDRLPQAQAHDYERELLEGRLRLEQAAHAMEQADRERAAARFDEALEQFRQIALAARSDPRPRLLACRAARGRLRAIRQTADTLPANLAELEPLCLELDVIEPGRVSSHAAQAAAYAGLAAAWDGVNEKSRARALVREGIAASQRGAELAPDDATLLEFRSRLFLRLAGLISDDFDAVIDAFDQGAEAARRLAAIAGDNPVAPMLLGTIERDRARRQSLNNRDPQPAFAAASAAFDRALALDPDSPAILGEAALNEVFRFYELRPDDPVAAVERAQRAIALQQRALDLDPDNIDLLFDQGANYGDLWHHLALHPEVEPQLDRAAMQQRALDLLARIRTLAPRQPSGYTQPIMILLTQAEVRLGQGLGASQSIEQALTLLSAARDKELSIDRDLATWVQITRVRSTLITQGDVAGALRAAWETMEATEVDRSDQFFRQLYRLELTGLEARWHHHQGRSADPDLLERGVETLDALLAKGRRQAIVLCLGARVLVHRAVANPEGPKPDADRARARDLFEECLALDDKLQPRFSDDLGMLARQASGGPAGSRARIDR